MYLINITFLKQTYVLCNKREPFADVERCLTVTRIKFCSLGQFLLCSFPSVASHLLKKYHGGYVVIRFALAGHKQANRPFYRIVAAFNKRARDSKYIEQLGSYDPLPNIHNEKLVGFNYDRIKYWIGCGAHPTKSVAKLLGVYSGQQHCTIFFYWLVQKIALLIVICLTKEVHLA